MSRIIATAAIRGAHKIIDRAEGQLTKAVNELGADKTIDLLDLTLEVFMYRQSNSE